MSLPDYSEDKNKQYHIQCGSDDIGKYVILPGDPGRCEKIASYFDDAKRINQTIIGTAEVTGDMTGSSTSMSALIIAMGLKLMTPEA